METLTVKELKQIAKSMKIKGWWNMTKVQLIEEIQKSNDKVGDMIEATLEDKDVSTIVNQQIEEKDDQEHSGDSEAEPKRRKKYEKRLLTYNGKTQTLNAWAKEIGVRHQVLYYRIVVKEWDVNKAFETPFKSKKGRETHAS